MKLLSIFIACLLLLSVIIIYTSCQKEFSYEDPLTGTGGGTAVYTLEANSGDCTDLIINGTYISGNALEPSNNIQLKVNVTLIGTFSITTSIVNGVQFSASGSFTAIGLQTILLIGVGTPVTKGTFGYSITVSPGCNFSVAVNDPFSLADFIFEDSADRCTDFKVNGAYVQGLTLSDDNTVEVTVNVISIGSYSISTNVNNGTSFSQSGNFTMTGIQKVILKSSGTPINAGVFAFSINSGCTFKITVIEDAPATYSLLTNPDSSCNGYSVSGTYNAGIPLLKTNNVQIKVRVTSLGSYSITTNTVNGITFSASGFFIGTGNNFVVLIGNGIPVEKGTFTFTAQITGATPIDGEGCSAVIEVM